MWVLFFLQQMLKAFGHLTYSTAVEYAAVGLWMKAKDYSFYIVHEGISWVYQTHEMRFVVKYLR
jgi:uncharacterized protein YqgQ